MDFSSASTSANRNNVLRMALNKLTFSSTADAPTLYGFLTHGRRNARKQYAKKIVYAYPGGEDVQHCVILCVPRHLMVRLGKRCTRLRAR